MRRFVAALAAVLAAVASAGAAFSGPESRPSASASANAGAAHPGVEAALEALGADVKSWGGSFGAVALDVGTGAIVARRSEHASLNPASNAKLATVAAALRILGPGHRFHTGLYGKLERDGVEELVLRGDGDPSLRTRDVAALAHELRSLGVRRVRALVVDQSAFDDRYVPPAFEQQPNEWATFRAPVSPVSLDENTVTFTVRPTKRGEGAIASVEPPGFVDVSGAVKTTAKTDPDKLVISLEAKGSRLAARIGGSIPDADRPLRVVRRVDDPRLLAGYALRTALKEEGIEPPAEVRLGGEREKHVLALHTSAPLAELVFALGKDSNNFYAETIFKAIAADSTRPGTAVDAAEAVMRELRALGGFEQGVVVKNGSGLFDANRTTPFALATLLRSAYRSPAIGPELVAELSIGGVDGTLHGRFKAWSKERAIRAKSGTLDAVAALSGYVLAPPGREPVAFSILVNGIPGKVGLARPSIDKVVDALARDLWGERSTTPDDERQ